MNRAIRLSISLILWAGLSAALYADPPSFSLGNVTVTATRVPRRTNNAPSDVTVITAAQIAASGAQTLAAAIQDVVGVSTSSYGPSSSASTVSIHGSTSGQVLVLVDGVPMNDPLTGTVDLSTIPLDDVGRIEVVKSGAGALYGTAAIGGVINIITKRSTKPSLSASIENGSYVPHSYLSGSGATQTTNAPDYHSLVDTQRVSLSATGSLGGVGLTAAGSFVRSQNGYLYLDPNNEERQLSNASLLGGDGSLGVSFPLFSGTLSADGYALYHASGVPGEPGTPSYPYTFLSPNARQTQSIYRGVLRYANPHLAGDLLSLDLTAYATQAKVTYVDPSFGTNDNHQDWLFGLQAQQRASLSGAVTLVYGASLSSQQALDTEAGAPHRFVAGAFVEPILSMGAFSLYPTIRYDYYSDYAPGDLSFILGATYRLMPQLTLRADFSRSYRAPDFNDLYYQSPGSFVPNPNLRPETAWNGNLGVRLDLGWLSSDSSIFVRYAQNQIVDLPEPGNAFVYQAVNNGLSLFPGFDEGLKIRFARRFALDLGYSFLYSFDLANGLTLGANARMPMTPVHTITAGLSYEGNPISGSVSAHYESLRYLDAPNTTSLAPFAVLNAIVRFEVARGWHVYLGADNLLNEEYQINAGYPMPPLFIKTGVEAHL